MTSNTKRAKATKKVKASKPIGKEILVNVILDRSGSMNSVRAATISGFNEYLSGLAGDKDTQYNISLTQFDAPIATAELTISYIDKPVAEVPTLSLATYEPRGNTPLYDAIGETLRRVADYQKGRPVLNVIITDGHENASTEFDKDAIKALIAQKEKEGWTFVFLGADIDASAAASAIGVQTKNAYNFNKQNVAFAMNTMSDATRGYAMNRRATGVRGQSVSESFLSGYQASSLMDPVVTTGTVATNPAVRPPEEAGTQFPGQPRKWTVSKPGGGGESA